MGGQTPNNIALPLHRAGIKMLGTSPDMIDTAENRYKFSRMLDRIGVDQPTWKELTSFEEAKAFCKSVSYPVLVRPSYVLSGAAMNTVYSESALESYLQQAADVSPEHPVVITKYIENAKEIEMDAVAKDGKVVGHFISEHVENAGVHSGDATLILPPQDLEKTTIQRIEEATRKIGDALNVTGPFNIQFIAKDNDIKVIECNVRASRSFPFVSKVMGVDLIEMATKAIMDIPFEAYPEVSRIERCVGVKVPQFSFSRLSGADPVLGVEMASTGEVASFGSDKYEAYLKALISTGFKIPKKNILLSIGSYTEKQELLPSIRKLEELGYNLYATQGTSNFLESHGVKVQFLQVFEGADSQNSEFSLTQHLANKEIDLYINLPSNNTHRRPANYISKGYQTRRMAVDYQIPLVTNVKNAKILIEAIARHFNLEVGIRDYMTSHRTIQLPGLVNIAAFVPGLVSRDSNDLQEVTKASIAAGFSMIRVMPLGKDSSISDAKSLKVAQLNSKRGEYCDFNFSVTATSDNAHQISHVAGEVGSLFIPFNHLSDNISKVAAVEAHFEAWPAHKPIITDARTTDLASILLLASLHNRRIHVTAVTTKDDIKLIALGKEKGLKVTCDVSVYSLYLSQNDYPGCDFLPTLEDQAALWKYLDTIDVFSIGSLPYQLAHFLKKPANVSVGIADALPLLLTSVAEGKLTVEDITARLHDKPKEIFELHDQVGTSLEVEIDRSYKVPSTEFWSPFSGATLKGAVRRVTFQDQVVCLDGAMLSVIPRGNDMSTHGAMPALPVVSTPPIRAMHHPLSPNPERQSSRPAFGRNNIDSASLPPPARGSAVDEVPPTLDLRPTVSAKLHQLLSEKSRFKKNHVLSVTEFDRKDLHHLFNVAQEMRLGVERHGVIDLFRNRVLVTLFYEPSTRTSASFDAAMQRLGGKTIPIINSASSAQKGETLQDTIRTVACYGDAIVLRHYDERSVEVAEKFSPVPVINGGNGSKEHPTQAFLDLFTIREELGTMKDLTITFVGDLLYGRPVHSLVYLLQHYQVKVQLVSPKSLALPKAVRDQLVKAGQLVAESESLTPDILARTDVLYCTRVQKERFIDLAEYEKVKDSYRVNQGTLKQAKATTVVLHPLPRNDEVAQELDFDQRAAYFRQVRFCCPPFKIQKKTDQFDIR